MKKIQSTKTKKENETPKDFVPSLTKNRTRIFVIREKSGNREILAKFDTLDDCAREKNRQGLTDCVCEGIWRTTTLAS